MVALANFPLGIIKALFQQQGCKTASSNRKKNYIVRLWLRPQASCAGGLLSFSCITLKEAQLVRPNV